jgi:hypothetical protein
MKKLLQMAGAGALLMGAFGGTRAAAQVPVMVPIIVDTAAPIVVNAVKPKPKVTGLVRYEGYVMNANRGQVTVKAKGNDMAIQTFPLSDVAAEKMQQVIDKGGYQYGDKITLEYDPQTLKVMSFKGKPSKSL